MDFLSEDTKKVLDIINSFDDTELREFIQNRTEELSLISKEYYDEDFIGYDLDINRSYDKDYIKQKSILYNVGYNPMYYSFIPKDVRIIYGIYSSDDRMYSNGCYFYMNDTNFLFEFCKFIRGKEIERNEEIFFYVEIFMNNYFGVIDFTTREDLNKLIYKNETELFKPIYEHSIKDFRKKSCEYCTERAAMAQNIISFLDYEIYYITGEVNKSLHAYNMFVIDDQFYLLDTSKGSYCYKADSDFRTIVPYIMKLDGFKDEDYKQFIDDEKLIETTDYMSFIINNGYYTLPLNMKRKYKILSREI